MSQTAISSRKLFVLDTNVLVHDPSALFRFQEHDVFLPMMVLEELDAGKKGVSEVARNVRQTSRFLDELMNHADKAAIDQGIPLIPPGSGQSPEAIPGRLFFETRPTANLLPESLPGHSADNRILAAVLALQQAQPDRRLILVSKDINLRIKATVLGIRAEDYTNDHVLDDVNLLYSGLLELSPDGWKRHRPGLESWQENGRSFYRLRGPDILDWYPNQCLALPGEDGFEALVRRLEPGAAVIERVQDYRSSRHQVWGIHARNREQNFALNLLLDPELDFVSLLGTAGTGKTLLALAAGLVQTLDRSLYREILMTRVTVPVGEDIGFLPGTEEEKMTPWMGALMDNLEVLSQTEGGGSWGRAASTDLLRSRIRIHSLSFMRGRTFLNRYIILDEAQNLTAKQMKTLVTRAGPGSKVVCLGNIGQIDTPYLTETSSGLTYAVDRFKSWPHSGHIQLMRGERSRLADFASQNL